MARKIRDSRLDTRNARLALKVSRKPYWRLVHEGLHVGYYRGVRGGKWTARRYLGDGRYEESALGLADDSGDADGSRILTFGQAQTAARRWQERRDREDCGLVLSTTGPFTVADALASYLEDFQRRGKGVATARAAISSHIIPGLGGIEARKLTARHIEKWMDLMASAPAKLRTASRASKPNVRRHNVADLDAVRARKATANRVFSILRAALRFAVKRGQLSPEPSPGDWRQASPFKETTARRNRYLNEEEARRLVNAAQSDFRALAKAALFTGARFSELAALKVADFDQAAGTVHIMRSKSGKERHVPLWADGAQFFALLTAGRRGDETLLTNAGRPWGDGWQKRPMSEACRRAGIEPLGFHQLRHSYASALIRRGVPLIAAATALGHRDTKMVERFYGHLTRDFLADAIRAAAPDFGTSPATNIVRLPG